VVRSHDLQECNGGSKGNRRPFLEDWAVLLRLLEKGKIRPIIQERFPILEAARANELLESGQVVGNIVLVAPELLWYHGPLSWKNRRGRR